MFKQRLQADSVLSRLCRNPLNLCILCLLLEENTTASLPQTKTDLYVAMEEFIVNRAASSMGKSYEHIKALCAPLDAIAYQGLISGRSTVSEDEVGMRQNLKQALASGVTITFQAVSRLALLLQRSTATCRVFRTWGFSVAK